MAGLDDMMKQAQAMRAQVEHLQQELAALTVVGESGAGLVRVTMNGRRDVQRVELAPSLLAPNDKEMTEDLIAAAINDAVRRVERTQTERLSELTAGLPLPPGMKLF